MIRDPEKLEHLITRYLDEECSADDRQLLESLLHHDAEVRALFDDYRRLDRCVGDAVRAALAPTLAVHPVRTARFRFSKTLTVAAAACLATLVWLQPTTTPRGPGKHGPHQAALAGSWFAPNTPQADAVEPVPSAYERPELRLRGTQRDWIVIPGNEPGTYMVIEVDHVRTHVIGVHRDF